MAFAQGLAEAGADVAIFDVLPPSADFQAVSSTYKVRTSHYTVDVSSPSSLSSGFFQFASDFGGKLDICVPCAGVNKIKSFLDTEPSEFDKLFEVNVKGVYYTIQLAAKQMIANGTKHGSIIPVASIASHGAIRNQESTAYCSTKGAVRAMVAPIAKEMAEYGIRVNSISPGYVRTEMTAPFPHLVEEWKANAMMHRMAEPDDLKGICVFLASDASSYMTGEDIVVDGGVTKW